MFRGRSIGSAASAVKQRFCEMALKSIMKSAVAGGWKSARPIAQTHDSRPTEHVSSNRPRALAPNDFDGSNKTAKGVGFTPGGPRIKSKKGPSQFATRPLCSLLRIVLNDSA